MPTMWIRFGGRFQCRLATDPDPYDEPRGVSGYMRALPGEPNLDRILRWQLAGTVRRSHCPPVGVMVEAVWVDGKAISGHTLLGAAVDLLDEPKFEGRNWVIATDGFEPIVPFHLRVSGGGCVLDRAHAASAGEPPFSADLRAQGLVFAPGEVREASGVWNLAEVWGERIKALEAGLGQDPEPLRTANQTRIATMKAELAKPPAESMLRYFPAKMPYFVRLGGPASVADPEGKLGVAVDASMPWMVDVWLGAWDPDALGGYVRGFLTIPLLATADAGPLARGSATTGQAIAEADTSLRPPSERRMR